MSHQQFAVGFLQCSSFVAAFQVIVLQVPLIAHRSSLIAAVQELSS
jgi:hypothetical protein